MPSSGSPEEYGPAYFRFEPTQAVAQDGVAQAQGLRGSPHELRRRESEALR